MSRISVEIDDELLPALEKRAKKSFFTVPEMIEDIVRRSMICYKGGKSRSRLKVDDKLVEIFSREKRGRKPKKKRKR